MSEELELVTTAAKYLGVPLVPRRCILRTSEEAIPLSTEASLLALPTSRCFAKVAMERNRRQFHQAEAAISSVIFLLMSCRVEDGGIQRAFRRSGQS